jgi:hypothetical protein
MLANYNQCYANIKLLGYGDHDDCADAGNAGGGGGGGTIVSGSGGVGSINISFEGTATVVSGSLITRGSNVTAKVGYSIMVLFVKRSLMVVSRDSLKCVASDRWNSGSWLSSKKLSM